MMEVSSRGTKRSKIWMEEYKQLVIDLSTTLEEKSKENESLNSQVF